MWIAVAAQVVDVGVTVVGREGGEVGVGALLAVLVGAVDGVVLGPDGGAELALGDEKAGRGAAAVVGGEQYAARVVESHVTGARPG